jgi:glycosyltransferase involved in cell wall biosynthesis
MYWGGALRSTCYLCEQLSKTNEVTVLDAYGISPEYHATLKEKNIPFEVLAPNTKQTVVGSTDNCWKRYWRMFLQIPSLIRLRHRLINRIRDISPVLIWTTDVKTLLILATCPSLKKYPVMLFARGWFLKEQLTFFQRWLIRNMSDGVLAVSSATARAIERWGVKQENIHVVFNTIDYNAYISASEFAFEKSVPGLERSIKILVPGQVLRTKGQHTAIEAAVKLNNRGYDFSMWIAGGIGTGDESNYYEDIKSMIKESGLEEKVFLLGVRNDIPALIRLADAVVLPTHSEGLPRVILEAMILKTPVVSTPVGGVTDLIDHGVTGMISEVEDSEGLARNLEVFFSNYSHTQEMAGNAYRHVCDRFSVEEHVLKVREAFEKVLCKK